MSPLWSCVVMLVCTCGVVTVGAELLDEVTAIPVERLLDANLSASQLVLVRDVRWNATAALEVTNRETRDGVPEGVQCERDTWCDAVACTEVCKRGTVQLAPWFRRAMKSQIAQARKLPLCFAQWLGTHNSGITLANGYGNRDRYYTKLMRLTKWGRRQSAFETYDQIFSITDQLNMGVRLVELDVHWVKGALRIAHCGGISNIALDYVASLVNVVAMLLGSPFRWDTDTLGCYPSASSIRADDQRLLLDAMEEIVAWMNQAENRDEFLIIFIDDQLDLALWGLLPRLRQELTKHIPVEQIFTPWDMIMFDFDHLPSADTLLQLGKRVMFLSRQYYSDLATRVFFFYTQEGRVCEWTEPHITDINFTQCSFPGNNPSHQFPTMTGHVCRLEVCEIVYGPLSCTLDWGENESVEMIYLLRCSHFSLSVFSPPLDSTVLKQAFECGLNFPSPDRLTPKRAEAAIWSWAPGHPKFLDTDGPNEELHTVMTATDGMWRSKNSSLTKDLPIVCRKNDTNLHFMWDIQQPVASSGGACESGYLPGIPRHGKENERLQELLVQRGVEEARLIGVDEFWRPST